MHSLCATVVAVSRAVFGNPSASEVQRPTNAALNWCNTNRAVGRKNHYRSLKWPSKMVHDPNTPRDFDIAPGVGTRVDACWGCDMPVTVSVPSVTHATTSKGSTWSMINCDVYRRGMLTVYRYHEGNMGSVTLVMCSASPLIRLLWLNFWRSWPFSFSSPCWYPRNRSWALPLTAWGCFAFSPSRNQHPVPSAAAPASSPDSSPCFLGPPSCQRWLRFPVSTTRWVPCSLASVCPQCMYNVCLQDSRPDHLTGYMAYFSFSRWIITVDILRTRLYTK